MTTARKAIKILLIRMFGKEVMGSHTYKGSAGKQQLRKETTEAIIGMLFF